MFRGSNLVKLLKIITNPRASGMDHLFFKACTVWVG